MRVLITGGTGFLGHWVAHAFVEAGQSVRLLVRKSPPDDLTRGKVLVSHGDILDFTALTQALRDVDAVVHSAGLVSLSIRERARLERVNVVGTRNVLRAAAQRGLPVLHTSSIATLGYTAVPEPQTETCFMSQAQASEFAYADSKLRAEKLVLRAAARGQPVISLNPGLLLGPGDHQLHSTRPVLQYLLRQMRMCLTGGISVADVRDVAAVYPVALQRATSEQRYLLGGVNLTYTELFSRLARITGLPAAHAIPHSWGRVWGAWSELAAGMAAHPLEELNTVSIKYGSMYNYCSSALAEDSLGYRRRDLDLTLRDTVIDHVQRGVAQASTPRLRQLLKAD